MREQDGSRSSVAARRLSIPPALCVAGEESSALTGLDRSETGEPPIALTRDGRWKHRASAHAANVGSMRTGLVEFAAQHGAGRSVQADIALVVSEGLTNAVVHAFVKQAAGTMSVIAVAAADVLRVSIIDDGSGMSPREDSPGVGWGLELIARLTSSLEIDQGPGGRGTELRLTLNAPGLRANGAAPHLTRGRAL